MRRSAECHLKLKIFSIKKKKNSKGLDSLRGSRECLCNGICPLKQPGAGKGSHFIPYSGPLFSMCRYMLQDLENWYLFMWVKSQHLQQLPCSRLLHLRHRYIDQGCLVKGSSGYRCILRTIIGGSSLTSRFCPTGQLWSCQGSGAFNETSLLRYSQYLPCPQLLRMWTAEELREQGTWTAAGVRTIW